MTPVDPEAVLRVYTSAGLTPMYVFARAYCTSAPHSGQLSGDSGYCVPSSLRNKTAPNRSQVAQEPWIPLVEAR
jgi:hypothetical protein